MTHFLRPCDTLKWEVGPSKAPREPLKLYESAVMGRSTRQVRPMKLHSLIARKWEKYSKFSRLKNSEALSEKAKMEDKGQVTATGLPRTDKKQRYELGCESNTG